MDLLVFSSILSTSMITSCMYKGVDGWEVSLDTCALESLGPAMYQSGSPMDFITTVPVNFMMKKTSLNSCTPTYVVGYINVTQ